MSVRTYTYSSLYLLNTDLQYMSILVTEDESVMAVPYKIALEKRSREVILTENGEACIKAHKFFIHSMLQLSANVAIKMVND